MALHLDFGEWYTICIGVAGLLVAISAVFTVISEPLNRYAAPGFLKYQVLCYYTLCVGQLCIVIHRACVGLHDWGIIDIDQAAIAALWLGIAVALHVRWTQGKVLSFATLVATSFLFECCLSGSDIYRMVTQQGASPIQVGRLSTHAASTLLLLALLLSGIITQSLTQVSSLHPMREPLLSPPPRPLKDDEDPERAPRPTRTQMGIHAFRYVWPDTPPLKLRLAACFVLVLAERGVNLAIPIMQKNMINKLGFISTILKPAADGGQGGGSLKGYLLQVANNLVTVLQEDVHFSFWSAFFPWAFAWLGFYLLRGGSGVEGLLANFRDLLWIPITQGAYRRISLDVFGHLLELDLNFHLHRKTGQIMRILDRGTSSIQDTVAIVLFNVVPQLIDIVVACTYLAVGMEPFVALIVMVTVASYVPLTVCITERRGAIRKKMNALDNERESRATDMLLNYETVKYFVNEKFELNVFDRATREYQAAEYWQMAFLSLLSVTQSTVVWVGLASGLVVCVRNVAAGKLDVGDVVLFTTMMSQLYVPLTYFGSYYRQVQKALIDMENMFELLSTVPRVQDAPDAGILSITGGGVTFQNVVFSYTPNDPPVLKGVSFDVPGGKTMAVVGATGSGKSTILRLLLRFYDPVSGQVMIDGQNIRNVTQSSLRSAIAVVPQDTVLFNDNLMYNIRYGRTAASDAEVYEAATVAHIHESIMRFPARYRTMVGERGLRLSGGEKQRIAFARAVLKRPAILVLDEATSALDSLTEAAVQSSLAALRGRCTTLLVAHRLSTVMDADIILVLDKGQVAEYGSHAELIETGGLYAAMWLRQQDSLGSHADLLSLLSMSSVTGALKSFPLAAAGGSNAASTYAQSTTPRSETGHDHDFLAPTTGPPSPFERPSSPSPPPLEPHQHTSRRHGAGSSDVQAPPPLSPRHLRSPDSPRNQRTRLGISARLKYAESVDTIASNGSSPRMHGHPPGMMARPAGGRIRGVRREGTDDMEVGWEGDIEEVESPRRGDIDEEDVLLVGSAPHASGGQGLMGPEVRRMGHTGGQQYPSRQTQL